MARTQAEIKAQMLAEKANQPTLAILNNPSQTSVWSLILDLCAYAINVFEQILNLFATQQTNLSKVSVPGTANWVNEKTKLFQYDATDVQALELNTITLAVGYPIINPVYQIITRSATIGNGQGNVLIKVATNNPPEALSAPQKVALENYWNPNDTNSLGFAGVTYTIQSDDADEVEIVGIVYFDGQYSAVINANVIAAINNYLANLPFNGTFTINALEDSIQAVTGVKNVRLSFVRIRRTAVAYGGGNVLYDLANNINGVQTMLYAGYAITETTASHTITDTLTFTAQ